jgi:E3 ubiquitin-protein ligase HERC4
MYSWGRCNSGQLGLGGIDDLYFSTPQRVKPPLNDSNRTLESVLSVGCGWEHTVIATANGEVYACGSNDHGQLGLLTGRKRFERVGSLETKCVKQVSCGQRHTAALSEGEVFTLGANSECQLGRKTDEDSTNVPRLVKGSWQYPVVQVTCGDKHTLILTADCQVFGWGSNSYHQVGLPFGGARIPKPEHIELPCGVPVVQVVAGGCHSLALTVSGCLYSWGKNNFGQLGVGDDTGKDLSTSLLFIW